MNNMMSFPAIRTIAQKVPKHIQPQPSPLVHGSGTDDISRNFAAPTDYKSLLESIQQCLMPSGRLVSIVGTPFRSLQSAL